MTPFECDTRALFKLELDLQRWKLQNEHPRLSAAAIGRKVRAWLLEESPPDPRVYEKGQWRWRKPTSI